MGHHFDSKFAQGRLDHDPAYRKVALSAMCSLACRGPEMSLAKAFGTGYSCKDLPLRSILQDILASCSISQSRVVSLASEIIALAKSHGMDTTQFGGRACASGKTGHVLQ